MFNERDGSIVPQFGNLGTCNIQISTDMQNTASSPVDSVNAYLNGYSTWDAIVGAARSACSTPVAMLGGIQKKPQLSYWSTSPDLDSVSYPYFGRTISSDAASTIAVVGYFKNSGWSNVGMLYIKDAYGTAYMNSAFSLATAANINLHAASFDYGDTASISNGLAQLKQKGVKIIVLIAFQEDFTEIWSQATTAGMVGPDYHWVFTDTLGATFFGGITDAATQTALKGSVRITPIGGVPGYGPWETFKNLWKTLTEGTYNPNMIPGQTWGQLSADYFKNTSPEDVSAYAFDALASFGIAACNVQNTGGDPTDGATLLAATKALSFTGLSGTVEFDQWTSRKASTVAYFLQNILPTSRRSTLGLTDIGRWDSALGKWNVTTQVVFNDGTTTVIADTWPGTEATLNTGDIIGIGIGLVVAWFILVGPTTYRLVKLGTDEAYEMLTDVVCESALDAMELSAAVLIFQNFEGDLSNIQISQAALICLSVLNIILLDIYTLTVICREEPDISYIENLRHWHSAFMLMVILPVAALEVSLYLDSLDITDLICVIVLSVDIGFRVRSAILHFSILNRQRKNALSQPEAKHFEMQEAGGLETGPEKTTAESAGRPKDSAMSRGCC